jgi:LacI family transcriptional regulator
MVARRVDGIILAPAPGAPHNLRLLTRRKLPVVLVDRRVDGAAVDVVRGDSNDAGLQLTRHLIGLGHRRIAFIGGPSGVSSLEERLPGYRAALSEAGLGPHVHLGRYDRASGERIIDELATRGPTLPYTALLAANNTVAAGATRSLARRGLHVPGDLSLACFEDHEADTILNPFLTVAVQPAYEIGQRATRLPMERIRGASGRAQDVVYPIDLILRRSAAPPAR